MKKVIRPHLIAILSLFSFVLLSCSQEQIKAPRQTITSGEKSSNENGEELGGIKAIVTPLEYNITMTIYGEATDPLEFASTEGLILAREIPAGNYTVVFRATQVLLANPDAEITLQNVQVVGGETTDLGIITFQ